MHEQLHTPSFTDEQDQTPKETNQQIQVLQRALDLFADVTRLGIRTDPITNYLQSVSQMVEWFQKAHELIKAYSLNIDSVGSNLKPITLQNATALTIALDY